MDAGMIFHFGSILFMASNLILLHLLNDAVQHQSNQRRYLVLEIEETVLNGNSPHYQ